MTRRYALAVAIATAILTLAPLVASAAALPPIPSGGIVMPTDPNTGNATTFSSGGVFLDPIAKMFTAAAPRFAVVSATYGMRLLKATIEIELFLTFLDVVGSNIDVIVKAFILVLFRFGFLAMLIQALPTLTKTVMSFWTSLANDMGAVVGMPPNATGDTIWQWGFFAAERIMDATPHDLVGAATVLIPEFFSTTAVEGGFIFLALDLCLVTVFMTIVLSGFAWMLGLYGCRLTQGFADAYPKLAFGTGLAQVTIIIICAIGTSIANILTMHINAGGFLGIQGLAVIAAVGAGFGLLGATAPLAIGAVGGLSCGITSSHIVGMATGAVAFAWGRLNASGMGGSGGSAAPASRITAEDTEAAAGMGDD